MGFKPSVNADKLQSKYQELLKYQNVYQYQKPTVLTLPKLLLDHLLVMGNQDKSVTQSQPKFHSQFKLNNATRQVCNTHYKSHYGYGHGYGYGKGHGYGYGK